ncbi:hypothetical protein D3C73_388270 [compost metagenome]
MRLFRADAIGQFITRHTTRHHHVGKQKRDILMAIKLGKRLTAVLCLDDLVAKARQT